MPNTDGFKIAFHCILAVSAGHSAMLGDEDNVKEILEYLSKTYRGIHRNLQRNNIPSDSTVVAVMNIAVHEDLLGQSERSDIHLDALS
jgi:hypothetical protein